MGASETERTAQRKQDDADYERSCQPVGPGPTNAKLL